MEEKKENIEKKEKKIKYSIIMPCYNEEENLPIITFLIFKMARENKLNIELIVVEDNSEDKTREIGQQLSEKFKKFVK